MVKRNGFTLIELLVVIAVIALLLSVILPSLQKAEGHAKKVICMSNLGQWGKVWGLYLNDNDNLFMDGWGGSNASRKTQWMVVIADYMKDYDHSIWTCPFADNENKCVFNKDGTASSSVHTANPMHSLTFKTPWGHIADMQHGGYDTEAGDYGSYGLNSWMYNAEGVSECWRKSTVSGASTNRIPVFGDAMWCEIWPQNSNRPATDSDGIVWGGWNLSAASINRHDD